MASPADYRPAVARVVAVLAKERKRQGMSMNQLAQKTGLSLTTISYIERGMRSPTLETVLAMAGALGLLLGDVLGRSRKSGR